MGMVDVEQCSWWRKETSIKPAIPAWVKPSTTPLSNAPVAGWKLTSWFRYTLPEPDPLDDETRVAEVRTMTRTNKTVDTIVMAEDHILFIRRAKEPFMDKLVLPGGHIEETDQSPAHAATRELLEEVGLQTKIEDLHFLITLDSPGRDPRGSKVSQVFLLQLPSLDMLQACQAGSDAQEIVVREINSLNPEEVGFDHWLAVKLLQ